VSLARIVTDLQAVCHLLRRGYVEQAVSLTAGMMELAHLSMMREYDEIYRDMNLAKHGNPMALASSTIEQRDEVIYVVAGPHSSVSGRRLAHTAILNAVRYTYLASMKYILDHVAQPERASIGSAWHPISRKWT
jgi:hypothetical protein